MGATKKMPLDQRFEANSELSLFAGEFYKFMIFAPLDLRNDYSLPWVRGEVERFLDSKIGP